MTDQVLSAAVSLLATGDAPTYVRSRSRMSTGPPVASAPTGCGPGWNDTHCPPGTGHRSSRPRTFAASYDPSATASTRCRPGRRWRRLNRSPPPSWLRPCPRCWPVWMRSSRPIVCPVPKSCQQSDPWRKSDTSLRLLRERRAMAPGQGHEQRWRGRQNCREPTPASFRPPTRDTPHSEVDPHRRTC